MTDQGKKNDSSPFAVLAALRSELPHGPVQPTREAPERPARSMFSGKLVVAKSRKGRGGNTVTTIAGLHGERDELDQIAGELKRALGCGAGVETSEIVLQGEQIDRTIKWLLEKGAKRVVRGT